MVLKRPSIVILVLALATAFGAGTVATSLTLAASQDREPAAADLRKELDKLLEQRLALIKTVVDQLRKQYEGGVIPLEIVQDALTVLREAELDTCKSPAERVRVQRKLVAIAKQQEQLVTKRVSMGVATKVDAEQARVARLEAEIWLLREQLEARSDAKQK